MKKLIIILTITAFIATMYSCQDQFLQVPDTTGNLDLNKVYSDSAFAFKVVVTNYHLTMCNGWGGYKTSDYSTNFWHGNISAISGEVVKGQAWHSNYVVANTGLSPVPTPGVSINDMTNATSIVAFHKINMTIRSNYLVIENIDKVPNMTPATKAVIKAESKGMIAYLYLYMFKNYGGYPIIRNSMLPTDNAIPRSSLQETLDFILTTCDEAVAGLPNNWTADFVGRLTKAAVLTTKAEALLIASRPLFNTGTPYINFGSNNNLVCFGSEDVNRWNAAIAANEAALVQARVEGKEILNTGGAGEGFPNPNAIADYGTATSTPNNSELIIAAHNDDNSTGYYANTSPYQPTGRYNAMYGVPRGMFVRYLKADGTEQDWPKAGEDFPRAGSDYVTRFKEMEPRFLVDLLGPGIEASIGNPGLNKWAAKEWNSPLSNRTAYFPNGTSGLGCAMPVKFYYKAGNRIWYEYPVFRVAQLYLSLAEAYNEVGNSSKALENLNIVHNRAGLPAIAETDKDALRKIIQREWDIEFFDEGKRYYNYREWKIEDIGQGAMYGQIQEFQFQTAATSYNLAASLLNYWTANTYTAYWNPKMFLEPFPQSEINKGTIIQNPGY